ncbi:uncharacterized protein LOC126375571, partial [Pectinophora gossypiella]|uniref:uncharacterized protein LOC126375571 n=1 Tax=Pectinophora gossypiella TaxID=13191 RepID=UPI00214E2C45
AVSSMQNCPTEVSVKGISVTWHESPTDTGVVSDPLCYFHNDLITRDCNNSEWIPSLNDLDPCLVVFEYFDLSSCPPSFFKISKQNNKYCYKITESSSWDYPCLRSGGTSIITELTAEELELLLQSLRETNSSRYFWLPAHRRKLFNPVVWHIPGPNWGQVVDRDDLQSFASMVKNCLMLDIENGLITTEACSKQLPSLCIYLSDLRSPARCPEGYHGFRFMSDNGTCFGIERTDNETGLTFDDFVSNKCKNPMGDRKDGDLSRFVFKKIAELNQLPDDNWCWFATLQRIINSTDSPTIQNNKLKFQGVIDNNATLGLMNSLSTLSCMACETEMIHHGETTLDLEYNYEEMKLFLTVYYPSGLWRNDMDDIGVQCFSDAKGFVKPIEVNSTTLMEAEVIQRNEVINSSNVEKAVYVMELAAERFAQYWCEGHNKTFSLLTTSKVIAYPKDNTLHVFALVIKVHISANDTTLDFIGLTKNLTTLFNADQVLLMDIFEYTTDYLLVLMHIHVPVSEEFETEAESLQVTYQSLKNTAVLELPAYDITFINISSSIYCLPTTSQDYIVLDWELTKIGSVAAARQFCLQSNGLPVKRRCHGSYLLGGIWGNVEGSCNENYEPSMTTTFLYNFAKGHFSENYTSRFLTDGLGFVLDDIDILIPADIYYLAMSLQHIIDIVQVNESCVDMGDIENMAWAMDRILLLDNNYLRLAQTFNSTNIILDSINDIIEKLAQKNTSSIENFRKDAYQVSIQPQFIIQISYPGFNNITGIAIINRNKSDNFTDMEIQPLYKNTTLDSVISIENLEVATWIPDKVLSSFRILANETIEESETINKDDIHIVVNVFHNDVVFQQLDLSKHVVNSRVVGLTVPGYQTNLIHSIPLLFRDFNQNNTKKVCGFWDFQTRKSGSHPGFWSNHGCYYKKTINNITICQCYHMTHFGQLLDIGEFRRPECILNNEKHTKALNTITLVGSFLSLLGIVGIWVTALVFQTWRKKPGTKVLLQLSTAIALPLIIIVVFNLDNTMFYEKDGKFVIVENKNVICIILGALLQYSILASFMWMLITAVLQFIRYVRVLGVCRPSRFMCKFALVGWGLPLIPVIIVLALDYENYLPDPTTNPEKRVCYPTGFNFIVGILIPVAVVLFINLILFASVLYSISRGPEGKVRSTEMDLVGAQLRLSLFLFFLLGLTWIFGILSFNRNVLWSYLFCLTSTLQGFVLFIYFVICDPATRSLWVTLVKPQFLGSSPRKSISSISSS